MTAIAKLFCALLLGVLAGAAAPAFGQSAGTDRGVEYVCTGFGEEDRNDPRLARFSLKLVFATAGGGYYADVDAAITDAGGAVVFEVHCDAPWLLVAVAPGKYRVAARAATGETRQGNVTVSAGKQTRLVIRFPGIPR